MKAESSRAAIAGDAFELLTQAAGACRAVFGTFGEHAEQEALELRGNDQMHFGRRFGRTGHDSANQFGCGASFKGRAPCEDSVECGPRL
jgi:hypothetical protein